MQGIVLFALLAFTYLMVIAKRSSSLVRTFRYQSVFLFLATLAAAFNEKQAGLYIISGLLFVLKVALIPFLLYRMIKRVKANEDLGMFINPQLSLLWALGFTYFSWKFGTYILSPLEPVQVSTIALAFLIVFTGLFLMVFRMTALAQIIGLLTMENGIFLLASTVGGGMPFFVEIAIFFDILVSVMIMGLFIYRISKLFTHIDVNKLSRLKG